ncbi:MAG: ArnT family glycosyltransferase [Planctomycetota bacterium]
MTAPRSESTPSPGGRACIDAFFPALAVALAFALRAWAFQARGVVDYDETYYYILGRNLIAGGRYTLNGLTHTAFPPLYPFLVGIASLFTDGIRAATSSVSAGAGALIVLPVYFLARDIYGNLAARLSALAAAVWPALFFVATRGVPSARKMYGGSEPVYATLVASGAALIWLFARRGGIRRAALGGFFFGLASLVRSEGPFLFAFVFLWLILERALSRSLRRPRVAMGILCAVTAMLTAYGPFLVYVRSAGGHWGLGAKLSNNVRIRNSLWEWITDGRPQSFVSAHYRLNDEATAMEDPYWGVTGESPDPAAQSGSFVDALRLIASPQPRWLKMWLRFLFRSRFAIVPWWLLAFIALGAVCPPRSPHRLRWWAFSACVLIASASLAVSLFVIARHMVFLAAFFAVPLGKGLEAAGGVLSRAIGPAVSFVPTVVALAAMLASGVLLNLEGNLPHPVDNAIGDQAAQRRLAGHLHASLPSGSTLMSLEPWIAVWAAMDWRVPPLAPAAKVVEYARNTDIEYALLSDRWLSAIGGEKAMEALPIERLQHTGPYTLYRFREEPADVGIVGKP